MKGKIIADVVLVIGVYGSRRKCKAFVAPTNRTKKKEGQLYSYHFSFRRTEQLFIWLIRVAQEDTWVSKVESVNCQCNHGAVEDVC